MRKSYLIAFIDDHSRLIPHGGFYLSEGVSSYLDALERAFVKRGLPRKLYVDNGAAFRSHHLEQVCASLGVALIHARPYRPCGKGKIERFFGSVRRGFVADLGEVQSLDELNKSFDDWISGYHQRKHSSTGQTPFARFCAKTECLRLAPGNLADHFRKMARRRVAKDRTIILEGHLFEAPVALIGKQVQVLYHEGDLRRVEVIFEDKSYGYLPCVDVHANCRIKRDKNSNAELGPEPEKSYRGGSLWE